MQTSLGLLVFSHPQARTVRTGHVACDTTFVDRARRSDVSQALLPAVLPAL